MRRVYLDNNATTPMHPEVFEAMLPYLKDDFGNPSSIHQFGRKIRVKVDEAREQAAALINADPSEIIFTGCGSEADNFAIKGVAYRRNQPSNGHIITSSIEHLAVLGTCKQLEKNGFQVSYLPVDEYGIVDLEYLKNEIRDETMLVTVHHSNNEIGTIEPIEQIVEICRNKNVPVHTDAIQSIGKIPFDMKELNIDLLSLSAHKLNGPKGIGALYIRKGFKRMNPLITGGHQEKNRRAGTENVAGIIGFGKACEIAAKNMDTHIPEIKRLRDSLQKRIEGKIPQVKLNGHPEKRLPTTLNMSMKFVEGESLLINLDLAGIAISTGSACTSGSLEPSHVLTSMGIPHETTHGSLRFSFGIENTDADVDYVMEHLPGIVQKVRDMSPLWEG